MRALRVAAVLAFLISARSASAHRLNEYLQAATIRLGRQTVEVTLRLTPGVSVYRAIATKIDTDGDGVLSPGEEEAYAKKVCGELFLSLDGAPLPLRLNTWSFPRPEEMAEGMGEMVLDIQSILPGDGVEHLLRFENRHEPAIGVYLVNCLVPTDPRIAVRTQDRNYDQSVYELRYSTTVSVAAVIPSSNSGFKFGPWMEGAEGWPELKEFFFRGIRHILTGYDHLLFVGALVMAAASFWDLVKVVTAFTLAHTITLTLAALDIVHVPASIVEPFISASIVYVALQNLVNPGRAGEWSHLLPAFLFGLFHGLGFANGLMEDMRGLPQGSVLLAIGGFSLGVEAGHQMVVLPLFAALKKARLRPRVGIEPKIRRLGSLAIAACGLYFLCVALVGVSL